tara:strand:+ start:514 stop:951 length:438 start_codon:yes stop_codon:yes gene_type:complete
MTTTTNYSFTLPTVGGSTDQWGTNLNANWTSIDTLLGGTSATEFAILDGATVTTVEVNYVSGVTSAIQTQFNAKSPIASPTFTGTATIPTATITTANITTADFGDWTVTEDAGVLKFATGGVNKMSLDASGNLTVTGNVNTAGTI